MKSSIISLYIILSVFLAQSIICCESASYKSKSISIPTAGNSWVINNLSISGKVITNKGITNWSDTSSVIRTYFRIEQTGTVNISARAKVISGTTMIEASFGMEKKTFSVSNSSFDTINIGTFNIANTGYKWIDFHCTGKTAPTIAEISDIIISGQASEGKVFFVKDDFYFGRRGPSVHLRYEIPSEASDIEWFYNEITIPECNDVLGSYFMANGFADGYFGIQVNSPSERRILFSVWSPYKTDNPGEIPDDYKIVLLKKGADVIIKEFGNEGSGGQSYRKYLWKAGNKYRFLLNGHPSVNNSTDYTAYFYAPETGKWDLIACFRRPKTDSYLKDLYSFLENFMPDTGPVTRKGYYSNQWVRDKKGTWFEIVNVKFTADATARKESRLDYSGGVENGLFFLRNCGFFSDKNDIDQLFLRPKTGNTPQINFSGLD
jgi:hypothetical protein